MIPSIIGHSFSILGLLLFMVGVLRYDVKAEDKGVDVKTNKARNAKEDVSNIYVLTLPKQANNKKCFPQKFVQVPVSKSRVELEECKRYADRKVAEFDGRIIIYRKGKYGVCDSQGNILVEPRFDYLESYSDGLAVVRVSRKYGYLNVKGKYAVKPTYDWAFSFHDGIGAVQLGRLWGLIDKEGAWVKTPTFKQLDLLKGGLYAVTTDGQKGFIDRAGELKKDETSAKNRAHKDGVEKPKH
jgi:hypothetical protein